MTLKEQYRSESELIQRFHRCGASGFSVSGELAELVDRTISVVWQDLPEEMKNEFAVIALGGYGRYEMCPHSDFDLMLVFENEKSKSRCTETAQKFLHELWNLGFDIGHSVRTIDDCMNLYQTGIDVWASVLESRYVCGSERVLELYTDAMLSEVEKKGDLKFVSSVLAGIKERHEKYGNSVKLLEPNLKNSAGGLRDVHSLVWIYRATNVEYFTATPFRTNESAAKLLFESFEKNGLIDHDERAEVTNALDFLLRVRHETHYHTDTIHDTLEFSMQREIAKGLGYGQGNDLKGVEQFMRDYFLHARNIYRLNHRLTALFDRSVAPSFWSRKKEQVLDDVYMVRNGELLLRNSAFEFSSPAQVLSAFYWCGMSSVELSHALLARFSLLTRSQTFFTVESCSTAEASEAFRKILSMEKNVSSTLSLMNDCDVLGRFLPEWGRLVAFFQHSMYHYYTTDAHTLIVLENGEKLGEAKSTLGKVFRSIDRKDLFYLALLFHDIEKPTGIAEHEVRGVDTAAAIMKRLHVDDPNGVVGFLIGNHLVMEQVAFRRNASDPATIDKFAEMFTRPEQLDLLYVLTYCDLSAVNKNVWSGWKESMLEELYYRTRRIITDRTAKVPVKTTEDKTEEKISAVVRLLKGRIDEKSVRVHFTSIANPDYLFGFSEKEIAEHIVSIGAQSDAVTTVTHEESYSAVTVITKDKTFLLSTLCGVFAANDTNIFDARIFTRDDGIVIDQFRIVNTMTRTRLEKSEEEKLRQDILDVLERHETLDQLFEKHHRRWRRRPKPLFHDNIRIDVDFHTSGKYTIIEVYSPDMTGFLYKVTQAMSKLNLDIHFAKLATRGDGIVDSFYVRKSDGTSIADDDQRRQIRERILHTIHQLINIQLAN